MDIPHTGALRRALVRRAVTCGVTLAAFVGLATLVSPPAAAQFAVGEHAEGPRTAGRNAAPPAGAKEKRITQEELAALTGGFADRYMTYIVSACDLIEKNNPSQEQKRLANQIRLTQVSSIYDIVTNADPYTQLLDLTLVVTLQSRKWIDEDQAEQMFGPRGVYLIEASRKAREDIWQIAQRVMKPEQLESLDYLIWDWRRKNPNVQVLSFVRFDDFASSRGKSVVSDVKSGGGLLAPVDEAKKAVDEVRLLGERAFFLSKRMPFLMNWQVRAAVDDTLADPQIGGLTASLQQASDTMAKLPTEMAHERAALIGEPRNGRPALHATLDEVRYTIGDTTRLAQNVDGAAKSADGLLKQAKDTSVALNDTIGLVDRVFMQRMSNAPAPAADAKPFNIDDYTRSLQQLTAALREANQLLAGTDQLLTSKHLDAPMREATERGERVVDAAFWRGALLIVLFFVMLGAYKLITTWAATRMRARNAA